MLTAEQAYAKVLNTFKSWLNWNKPTDAVGLLIGLGDYYIEIRMLEDELNIPANEQFNLAQYKTW